MRCKRHYRVVHQDALFHVCVSPLTFDATVKCTLSILNTANTTFTISSLTFFYYWHNGKKCYYKTPHNHKNKTA